MELLKKFGLWALAAVIAIAAVAAYFVVVRAVAAERDKKFAEITARKDSLKSRADKTDLIPSPAKIKASKDESEQRSVQADECELYLARQPRRAQTRSFFREEPYGAEIEISADSPNIWLDAYKLHNENLQKQLDEAGCGAFHVEKLDLGSTPPTPEQISHAMQLFWYQKDMADFLTQQDEKDLTAYMQFKASNRTEALPAKPSDLVIDPRQGARLEDALRSKSREKLVAILSAIVMNAKEQDLAMIFNTWLPAEKTDQQPAPDNGFPWERAPIPSEREKPSVLGFTMDEAQRRFLDEMVPADKPDLSNRQRFVNFVMEMRTVRYRADVSGLLEAHGFEKLAASIRKGTEEELAQVLKAIGDPNGEWNDTRIVQAIAAVVSIRDDKDFRLVRNNHAPDIKELSEVKLTYTDAGAAGRGAPASGPYRTHYFKMRVRVEFERIPVFLRRIISNNWRYRVQFTTVTPPAGSSPHPAPVAPGRPSPSRSPSPTPRPGPATPAVEAPVAAPSPDGEAVETRNYVYLDVDGEAHQFTPLMEKWKTRLESRVPPAAPAVPGPAAPALPRPAAPALPRPAAPPGGHR